MLGAGCWAALVDAGRGMRAGKGWVFHLVYLASVLPTLGKCCSPLTQPSHTSSVPAQSQVRGLALPEALFDEGCTAMPSSPYLAGKYGLVLGPQADGAGRSCGGSPLVCGWL